MASNHLSRRQFLTAAGALALGIALGRAPAAAAPLASRRGDFFLEDGLVYLNAGTLGPTPRAVAEAAWKAWQEVEANPAEIGFGPYITRMEEVRAQGARFLGCAARRQHNAAVFGLEANFPQEERKAVNGFLFGQAERVFASVFEIAADYFLARGFAAHGVIGDCKACPIHAHVRRRAVQFPAHDFA